jgi:radical SAM superfamily enzyme YgiQ (UPF0313 family)
MVLLFKNIFYSQHKEENDWISQSALYLASALKKAGIGVVFSSFKFSRSAGLREGSKELEEILKKYPRLDFIGFSLCEDFFEDARELVGFLRKRTDAFIGVGGVMPTLSPEHVFCHLSKINFLVRGAGEEVFPRLVKILAGKNIRSALSRKDKEEILKLRGIAFRSKGFVFSSLDKINEIADFDRSQLDMGFLRKENLSEGLNLFTSRGCFNNCFFCTTPGRGRHVAKSVGNLKLILKDYRDRLAEIFGDDIPPPAYKISFNDDDFLADPDRAASFFHYIKKAPFRINFFQTGINSFFERRNGRYTRRMNKGLLDSLSPEIFSGGKSDIYIGTENFCGAELARLGKGYDYGKAEKVVKALAARKIHQVHHFIVSNNLTTPQDILDNLTKIAAFQSRYGEHFRVLTPVIPYLVSLYPSASYKIALRDNRKKYLNIRAVLSDKSHPQLDYPLVVNDIPINTTTREMVPIVQRLFSCEEDYTRILDATLFKLLLMSRADRGRRKNISRILDDYKDYPARILKMGGKKANNERYNLQLMVTRRCHLRCRYCPVEKKDSDMSEDVLYRAVELLFTSSRDKVRLDFTGGEPLLRFDLINKAVKYARHLSRRKGKEVSFYLVTNLIELTDQIADFLKSENFFLELSVDGEERWHNLYKIGMDSHLNPYRATTPKLNMIFSRNISNYAVMVVSPLTVKHLGSNFYHLLKLGFRNIGINYGLGLWWEEKERDEFFRQLDLVKGRFYPLVAGGLINLMNLGPRNEPAILNSEVMVDTDGEVHLLTDWLFETKMKTKAPSLGRVADLKDLNGMPLSRFRTLQRLLEYCPSPRTEKVILNNIEMGNAARAYFKEWKKK